MKKMCLFLGLCIIFSLCSCAKEDSVTYSFNRADNFKTTQGDIIIKERADSGAFHWSFDELVALYFNAVIRDINDNNRKEDIDYDNVFYQNIETQVIAVKDSNCDSKTKAMIYEINVNVLAVRYAITKYNADKTDENFDYIIQCLDKAYQVYTSYVK